MQAISNRAATIRPTLNYTRDVYGLRCWALWITPTDGPSYQLCVTYELSGAESVFRFYRWNDGGREELLTADEYAERVRNASNYEDMTETEATDYLYNAGVRLLDARAEEVLRDLLETWRFLLRVVDPSVCI